MVTGHGRQGTWLETDGRRGAGQVAEIAAARRHGRSARFPVPTRRSRGTMGSQVALRDEAPLQGALHQTSALLVLLEMGNVEAVVEHAEVALDRIDAESYLLADLRIGGGRGE